MQIPKKIENDPTIFVSVAKAIDIRDYLMLNLCVTNCLRSSNLINITLDDFNKAKKHGEIQNAYTFTTKKYKTSLIYGSKVMLVSAAVSEQLEIFVKHIRPTLINDEKKSAKLRNFVHIV